MTEAESRQAYSRLKAQLAQLDNKSSSYLVELDEIEDWIEQDLDRAQIEGWTDLAADYKQLLEDIKCIQGSQRPNSREPHMPAVAEVLRKQLWGKKMAQHGLKAAFRGWTKIPTTGNLDHSHQVDNIGAISRSAWGYIADPLTQQVALTVEVSCDSLDQATVVIASGKRSFRQGGQVIVQVSITEQPQLTLDALNGDLLRLHPTTLDMLKTILKPSKVQSQLNKLLLPDN